MNDTRLEAYQIISGAYSRIRELPRFKGQAQLAAALRRILLMKVWDK